MLTPCEMSMDSGGIRLLLLGPFGWWPSLCLDVPKRWSRARRPRLRYCLLNPIFIFIICGERNVKKQNFNNQMFQSQLPSGCGLRINGRFNDRVQP